MNPEYERLRSLGYKTHEELDRELSAGTIRFISGIDAIQANDLARASLPLHIRFSKEGDIYIAKEDTEVNYMTHWEAPYTGGGKGILPKNEKIQVLELGYDRPIAVGGQALRYKKVERLLITEEDRKARFYAGYSLSLRTLDLNEKFKLVEEGAPLRRNSVWYEWLARWQSFRSHLRLSILV